MRRGVRALATGLGCIASALLLGACGGHGGGGGPSAPGQILPPPDSLSFWAHDFSTGQEEYQVTANRVGEGSRCIVYLEQGRSLPLATVDALVAEFDDTIYPRVTAAFGNEPNPGVDGNPKIFLLLLDIRDGFFPGGSYVAGYFHPINEFTQSDVAPFGLHSNEKEMFYMDVDPATPGTADFLGTLAHEFQHMIHFNQEEIFKGGDPDDTWLNEAMSEAAPLYAGYGPDYGRVFLFEGEPWNSLTVWGSRVEDYGPVYMWAQYFKDRIDPPAGDTIFRRMLRRPERGIASVNGALAEIGYGRDFAGTFRDWAVANYSGNTLSWPGRPEWSYVTVNTWPGRYPLPGGGTLALPGLFGDPSKTNRATLRALPPWSVDYYLYTPSTGGSGTVTWTPTSAASRASLADNATLTFDLLSGVAAPYTGAGYLAASNPSGAAEATGDDVAFTSVRGEAPTERELLAAAGRDLAVARMVAATGRPFPVCIHPFLRERVRPMAEKGLRPWH